MPRVRDGGRIPVEVELLNAIVAVGHDHGGRGCRAASRTVQATRRVVPSASNSTSVASCAASVLSTVGLCPPPNGGQAPRCIA